MNIFSEVFYDFVLIFVMGYATGVISAWILADVSTYCRSKRHQEEQDREVIGFDEIPTSTQIKYTVEVTVVYEISVSAESNDDAIEFALDKWSVQEVDDHQVIGTKITQAWEVIP